MSLESLRTLLGDEITYSEEGSCRMRMAKQREKKNTHTPPFLNQRDI